MSKNNNSKIFFYLSLCVVGYFCLLLLNAYVIKSDFVLIGVFQEMLTIPLLFFQLVLLALTVIRCFRENNTKEQDRQFYAGVSALQND